MTPEFQQKLIAMLSKHEGRVPWMYPDAVQNVTVGVGHMIPSANDAVLLGFIDGDESTVTEDEIMNGWNYVKASGKPYKTLILPSDTIDSLLLKDIAIFYPVLIQTFSLFESYPEPARLALYDMVFNLGGFRKFPRFKSAVQDQNWTLAAQECNREGIGASRNEDTKELLLQCAA